uniref:Proteasome activator complex subunit 3 n=2 Tax=Globodera TaxID=31242 RepID=A0A914GZB0_GLORO
MSTGKKASNKKIEDYKNELLKEAEAIVEQKFPSKVIEFNELLKNPKYQYDRLVEITALTDVNAILPAPTGEKINDGVPSKRQKMDGGHDGVNGVPIYGFAKGSVKCNEKLAELIDELRPLLREAIEDVNKVKVWIQFLIPKIEDGNNFGVSIQEECLNETRNVEADVAGFLDQMSKYFASRARIVTKIAKYPHVEDYRRAMLDTDEKQFINIRLVIIEMRNHFATLYDLLMKNIDKIKKPRTSHAEHMMY